MPTFNDIKLKSKLYYYAAQVVRVYDGDTVTVDIDLGLGVWQRGETIRLWKINTPEVRGAERQRGLEVRDFVSKLVLGKTILLRTILDKRGRDTSGKYGRLLGEILLEQPEGEPLNVNELLLTKNMALPMSSGGTTIAGIAGATTAFNATPCRYCGETRSIDSTGMIAMCPNCFDPTYTES